jgi:dienelactone hydrolase
MRLLALILLSSLACSAAAAPKTVRFLSADEATNLVAFLFEPTGGGPHPAIVMLHGRGGAFSSLAQGVFTAQTLSDRHKRWADFWVEHGYVVLLVDSFSPRGHAEGLAKGDRPKEVSDETVRPLDAYGALQFLRKQANVDPTRIGLQGWSNGATTTLVSVSLRTQVISDPTPETAFRAAFAAYPNCGAETIRDDYRGYAPLLVLIGSADTEASPTRCQSWSKRARSLGNDLEFAIENGAEHDFDDPSRSNKENPANQRATDDAMQRAEAFFAKYLTK